jgi:hypothetical protein
MSSLVGYGGTARSAALPVTRGPDPEPEAAVLLRRVERKRLACLAGGSWLPLVVRSGNLERHESAIVGYRIDAEAARRLRAVCFGYGKWAAASRL